MKKLFVPVFLAALLAAPIVSAAGSPDYQPIPRFDPLAQPAPELGAPLRFAPDSRPWIDKLTPRMKIAKTAPQSMPTMRVIVSLHDPLLADGIGSALDASDEIRQRYVAAAAHEFARQAAATGLRNLRALSHFPIVFGEIAVDDLPKLGALPIVRAIEPDEKKVPARAEGMPLVHSDTLRNSSGGTGAGLAVAVVDSGIDRNHPEFGGRVTAGGDFTSLNGDSMDDTHSHGTACAGIIAGSQGEAPQAKLWAMKVFDENASDSGYDSVILAALNSCYANKDKTNLGGPLRVINMSLGGGAPISGACDGDYPSYATVMTSLTSAKIPIFVSSGNDGCSTGIAHPACMSMAIAVGAVYDASYGRNPPDPNYVTVAKCAPNQQCWDDNTQADLITCYSNSGDRLDILAPSDCARTTRAAVAGKGQYFEYPDCFGGTSAAAPYSSGVAAQILSLRTSTTWSELKNAMKGTGQSITDNRNGITVKRIDAAAAYQALTGGGGTTGTSTWVAVSAHAAGSGGSFFKTNLGVMNRSTSTAHITVKLHTSSSTLSGTATLAPGAHDLYPDIVGQLTSNATAVGSLEIVSDQSVFVSSRTYNDAGSAGTFGQGIDGITSADTLSSGQSGWIINLEEDAGFRSNLGFVNIGSSTASVQVQLFDDNGSSVGTYTVSVPAGQVVADNRPYSVRFSRSNITPGYAKVTVTSGSGVWAYGSILDNKTSDPTTSAMVK